MMRTIRASSTNLTCIPTYVGYLAIRELWGKDGDALILVDRHFCDSGKNPQQTLIQAINGIEKKTDELSGYHSNFFFATLRLESTNATTDRDGLPLPLKQKVSWKIERISKNWLQQHEDQHHPHVIIMGNSLKDHEISSVYLERQRGDCGKKQQTVDQYSVLTSVPPNLEDDDYKPSTEIVSSLA